MALDKAIKHGREKRKPYYGAKAIDHTCRNHGSCPWCQGKVRYKRLKEKMKGEVQDADEGTD
jgi:ferredoxin